MATAEKPKGGLEDVVATSSAICYLDGERGVLAYCGYDIHELAQHATFEEVCYLLWQARQGRKESLEEARPLLAAMASRRPAWTRVAICEAEIQELKGDHQAATRHYQQAIELGEQCLQIAQRVQDAALLLEAHYALGISWFLLGNFTLASTHMEQTIALYDPAQHHVLAYRYGGLDPGMVSLSVYACALWLRGYPAQARVHIVKALSLAQQRQIDGLEQEIWLDSQLILQGVDELMDLLPGHARAQALTQELQGLLLFSG